MSAWVRDIELITCANSTFRTVLFTGGNLQLMVMSLQPGEEVGLEMHDHRDQFLRVEEGNAKVTLGPSQTEVTETRELADNWAVIVPGGTWHNVINTGDIPLRLYSLYAPPEHPDGAIHATEADAITVAAAHDS